MTSPILTVLVLAVLWLIVVVPMVLRRHDDRAQERSVEQFGTAMRALTRRHVAMSRPARLRPVHGDADRFVTPRGAGPRADLFVTGTRPATLAPSVRRPVPAAEEALMYPIDRFDLSPARAQMMARRRRSLVILGVGSALTMILALIVGGPTWVPALLFVCGLGGYVYFLRSQVMRDRERREARQRRADARHPSGYDATDGTEEIVAGPEAAVRIDDEDVELQNLDTVDLTGLYDEDGIPEGAAQRRAS